MNWKYSVLSTYLSSAPPNIVINASLNNNEAGRELGREPPPVAAPPGNRKGPDPDDGLFKGTVSSEGGREGLGVRTLKRNFKTVTACKRQHIFLEFFFLPCLLKKSSHLLYSVSQHSLGANAWPSYELILPDVKVNI